MRTHPRVLRYAYKLYRNIMKNRFGAWCIGETKVHPDAPVGDVWREQRKIAENCYWLRDPSFEPSDAEQAVAA